MKNPLLFGTDCKCKIFLVIVLVVIFMLFEYCMFILFISIQNTKFCKDGESQSIDYYQIPTKYLINTPVVCKIPDIYPFSTDIASYIYRNPLAAKSDHRSKIFLMIVVVVFFMYRYSIFQSIENTKFDEDGESHFLNYYNVPIKYLINTPTCKIPDIDPFSKDIANHKVEHLQCRKLELLTYIEKRNETVILYINTSILHLYSSYNITCCYSKIIRSNDSDSDKSITYSPCSTIEDHAIISHPYIKVNCSDPTREVYANVYAITIPTKKQLETSQKRKGVFSVLLVGIGGISKLNLKHAMPKTYKYLEKHFISLRGYSNIGDNTYRNLMAILTGKNERQVGKRCGYGNKLKLEECGFIWDVFKTLGYVTAYAEDASTLGVSNYPKRNFVDSPTDYYYRLYMLASEKLSNKYNKSMCAGPESYAERMLNIIKDVSVSLNIPKFGFFWINNVSHDDVNDTSAMDVKIEEFLNDSSFKSSLKSTIMIFFSDHGLRSGNLRYTHAGWLEERLPIMYFYIPDSFKQNYPEKYNSLLVNTLRLTTPYDVYNTLQEILELANNTYIGKRCLGCPKCQSLFEQINELRTCKDAAIDQHWCACTGHTYVNPHDFVVQPVARFIVNKINSLMRHSAGGDKCVKFNLEKVISAGISEPFLNDKKKSARYLVVIVQTYPAAEFEASVEIHLAAKITYKLLGDISRLDKNTENSHCVKDVMLKKYCYCG